MLTAIPRPIAIDFYPFSKTVTQVCALLQSDCHTEHSHDNDVCAPDAFTLISSTFKVGGKVSQNYNMDRKKWNAKCNFLNIRVWKCSEYIAWPAGLQVHDQGGGWHITLSSQTGRFMARVTSAGSSFGSVNGDVAKSPLHHSTFQTSRDDAASLLRDPDWQFDIRGWINVIFNFSSGENHAGDVLASWNS